jgi:predicted hydrocarbon binding protein
MAKKQKGKEKTVPKSKTIKRTLKRAPRPKRQAPATLQSANYRELLLTQIMDGKDRRTYPLSVEFLNALCSSSKSLNAISYNTGISVGRLLYRNRKSNPSKKMLFRNEYLQGLANFLESTGIGRVTFHPTSHGTLIRVYRESPIRVGNRIHRFEAGIIAGFLGAAATNIPYIKEELCTSKGDDLCEYVAMPMTIKREDKEEASGPEMIQRLALELAAAGRNTERSTIPVSYHALLAEMCFDRAYSEQINMLVEYLGSKSREEMERNGYSSKNMWENIITTTRLLNFGEPSIERKGRKSTLKLTIDPILSRKEFARMVAGFINAVASSGSAKASETKINASNKRYSIKLTLIQ